MRQIEDHKPLLAKLRAIKEPLTGVVVLPPGFNHRVAKHAYEVQPHAGHLNTAQQVACDHGVTFDQVAAAPMTVAEVRAKYPRLDGLCPKGCGFHGIAYKSTAHFVYGDW